MGTSIIEKSSKKESFSLSTAVSFLPVMDDTEDVTKQLIASIKMYDSLLDEESKPVLINFIMTSRLSPIAKVRLTKNYKTVDHLVNDMNKYLLTKKSFTAIQQQLQQCTQEDKEIDAYGKEIENLFVELTIAQADGDQNKHRVLRSVNEKTAINRFATGLKNANLSTIILARDYKTLKDAIQGAKDEQISMSLNSNREVKPEFKEFSNTKLPDLVGKVKAVQETAYAGQISPFNQPNHDHPFLWKDDKVKNFTPYQNQGTVVKHFDGNSYSQRGRGHSARGHTRGSGHSGNHHDQRTPGKNFDNHDGNKQAHSQNPRGNSRGAGHSGNQHTHGAPGKTSDNRDGNKPSQRGGHNQSARGNSRGANNSGSHNNQGAPGSNNHGSRGGSRGASNSTNHHNRGAPNSDKRDKGHRSRGGHNQGSRGNSRGAHQAGSYQNQGNRGQNPTNRGGNNNASPVVNVGVPGFMVDCQFRFTAVAGGSNAKTANNPNKQVAKK